ncbi:xylose isomerase-like protein [Periconia macrospinosa]|uniref:Xylose isomerase-like protein n=1 Tax=Periconia macrospinosa TaxID=97972 RepID=A0A2V1DK17_9PLEO|nr:xylose isomerase-like protein [Periconia macrospinosa]
MIHLSSHTWMRPEPLRVTLARLRRLGYSSIELAGEPEFYPIDETRQLLQEYNIKCWGTVTIQTGTRDLTSPNLAHRRDTIEYMKQVVLMSSALGGEIVTVVPGRVGKTRPEASPQDEWQWAVEGLREVASFAQKQNIKIGVEPLNRFETSFLNRTDQAIALVDEVGFGCGIVFDPFHLAMEERDLYAAMRACGSRIVDVHVADNNRLGVGDGSLDWPKIIRTLKEVGYEGALAFEASPPIDRSPVGGYGAKQLDTAPADVPLSQLQFITDHASGVLADEYYTALLKQTAEALNPLL